MWVPKPSSITRYLIRDTAEPLPATASRRLYNRLLWQPSAVQLPCVLGKHSVVLEIYSILRLQWLIEIV